MTKVDQDRWVQRLRSEGETRDQAIGELRNILVRGLTAACRDRYGNKVQPEDATQDALIKILEKLDTFEGRSKFTTWAMTIAVRTAMSQMRRKHFQDVSMEALLSDSMQFEPEAASNDNNELVQEKVTLLNKLRELIDTILTERQRDAMHSLLNGMPVEVFAEATGSNRNAVYKLVHDARIKLRKGFEKAGYQAEDVPLVFA